MSLDQNVSYGFQGPYVAKLPLANVSFASMSSLSAASFGVIIATAIYALFHSLLGRPLVDKNGNGIPEGPRGLPIVGELR